MAAAAPAALYTKKMPATPRRLFSSPFTDEATSSPATTWEDLDGLHVGHLGGHVEVHDVPAVIAVDVEDAGALVYGLRDLEHLVGAGGLEDAAHGTAVEEAVPDVAEEEGQMAGAAAGGYAHLAFFGRGRHDAATVARREAEPIGMGGQYAVHHLVHEIFGLVQEFLHLGSPL